MTDLPSLIVPSFGVHAEPNEAKSKASGRPIFDEIEICTLRFAGDKQKVAVFPAHEPEPNATRERGEPITYAMLYNKQYRAFKEQTPQDVAGTPLAELPFLTQGKRLELKALNVHTAEALAALDGQPLKQLGMGGREMKEQARAYLAKANGSANVTEMAAKIADLERRLAEAEAPPPVASEPEPEPEPEQPADKPLEECSDDEIKAWIKERTGESVRGNPSRETLLTRAMEIATAPEGDGE